MTLRSATVWLGGLVAAAYLVFAIAVALTGGHWDEAGAAEEILWYSFLVGGGVLIVVGLRLLDGSPWRGAALVSLGAILGALPIFWALAPLVLAATLVVLSVLHARRTTSQEVSA